MFKFTLTITNTLVVTLANINISQRVARWALWYVMFTWSVDDTCFTFYFVDISDSLSELCKNIFLFHFKHKYFSWNTLSFPTLDRHSHRRMESRRRRRNVYLRVNGSCLRLPSRCPKSGIAKWTNMEKLRTFFWPIV